MIVYHGSSRMPDLKFGITFKNKKGRYEYGCGFYTTTDYYRASRYGRCVSEIDVTIDVTKSSAAIFVDTNEILKRYSYFCSIATSKALKKRVHELRFCEDQISLDSFFTLIYNNDKTFHLRAKEINDIFLSYGCDYTRYNDIICVHNHKIINSIRKY